MQDPGIIEKIIIFDGEKKFWGDADVTRNQLSQMDQIYIDLPDPETSKWELTHCEILKSQVINTHVPTLWIARLSN